MMVVYGDNVVRFDLDAFEREHAQAGAEISIALFDQTRHQHTGIAGGRVELSPGGQVSRFVEGAATEGLVNAGVYVVDRLQQRGAGRRLEHFPPHATPNAVCVGLAGLDADGKLDDPRGRKAEREAVAGSVHRHQNVRKLDRGQRAE